MHRFMEDYPSYDTPKVHTRKVKSRLATRLEESKESLQKPNEIENAEAASEKLALESENL